MYTRFLGTFSFLSCLIVLSPGAAAGTLLVGFHQFGDASRGSSITRNHGDEGVFAASSTITYNGGSTSTGGSTDNYYGADNASSIGFQTNQTPFDPVADVTNGPYLYEVSGGNARQNSSYAASAPQPSNTTGSGAVTTADGRVRNLNGTDLYVRNDTSSAYLIDRLLFDSFLGDVSDNSQRGILGQFPVTIFRNDGTIPSRNLSVTQGFAGYNMQSGESVDQSMTNPNLVDNLIDYGVGTNYMDYVVELGGFILNPGEAFTVGFNVIGSGVARGDNFAIVGRPVPEPMTALAFAGMLGMGVLGRRRRKR
ncbi:PEP-CTERM sorting domain-containing protein [Allorhodopirellula solitaria]|uniref:PEP-CTERM protein-sorting domain-containing protein n=1 Tax=Allorhodopirellula solitaria TaxID=2527987 RepID=A0A5C5XUQ2_9BACT|nr:PEP-CTERM sorting domain-containing protein [Allorhodopirellula solitaria]TWT66123.1 hypothetical protein CA85_29870 [Allorhodopirellula solitaria]